MCLGPGTEIQVTGNLFWRKIGPLICWPIFCDFFADFGAGLQAEGLLLADCPSPHFANAQLRSFNLQRGAHLWDVSALTTPSPPPFPDPGARAAALEDSSGLVGVLL